MSQFHFTPDRYLELIRSEVPRFDELQDAVARATAGAAARDVLELGAGTGETTRRILEHHPGARLVGIDASAEMLAAARAVVPAADLRVGRLEDGLPEGPFDLVVSCLVVHHLDGEGKRELFRRIAAVLRPGGRFVLGDVVVPERAEDAVAPLTPGFDLPDRVDDQLRWLGEAGFEPNVEWAWKDLAVVRADHAAGGPPNGTPPPWEVSRARRPRRRRYFESGRGWPAASCRHRADRFPSRPAGAAEGDCEARTDLTRRATFRGGIYVTGLEHERDRVIVGIFASRPVSLAELRARLTLRDSTGTRYEHATHEPLAVEGRARLLFTPAVPAEATWLQLSEPGSGRTWLLDPAQAEGGGPG